MKVIRFMVAMTLFYISGNSCCVNAYTYTFRNATDDYVKLELYIEQTIQDKISKQTAFCILSPQNYTHPARTENKPSMVKMDGVTRSGDSALYTVRHNALYNGATLTTLPKNTCLKNIDISRVEPRSENFFVGGAFEKSEATKAIIDKGWRCYDKKWKVVKKQIKMGKNKGAFVYDLQND